MTTLDEFRKMLKTRRVELESKIDAALVAAASMGRRGIKMSTVGWPVQDIVDVGRDFRDAGWQVNLVTDQRDGDYIEVTAP